MSNDQKIEDMSQPVDSCYYGTNTPKIDKIMKTGHWDQSWAQRVQQQMAEAASSAQEK